MKLGVANSVAILDADLVDTLDVRFGYSDVVLVLSSGQCDDLAQDWLDLLEEAVDSGPITLRCAA